MRRLLGLLLVSVLAFSIGCNRDPVARSNSYVASGNKFFGKGKYKEASIMYRKALIKYPKNGEAYYHFALTLLKLQDVPGAVGMLRRAVDVLSVQNPQEKADRTDAVTKLADIYWLAYAQQPDRSKSLLTEIQDLTDQLLKTNPNSYDGLRLSGYVALANKDLDTAMKDVKAARAVKPDDPNIAWMLAQILLMTNHADDAEALAKETIEKHKTFGPMYDFLAGLYASRKQTDRVEQVFKARVENNPKSMQYAIQLGAFYYFTLRRADMDAVFQRLNSDQKDFPTSHLALGQFFMNVHDLDRAKSEFEQGMQEHPQDKITYQKALVVFYSSTNKTQEAMQLIDTVLKEDPKDDQAIQMKSGLLLASGGKEQIAQATRDLEAQVRKVPSNGPLHYQYARALLRGNQVDAARVQLEEALRLRPDLNPAKLMLTEVILRKGEYGKAQQYADEIIAQEPRNVIAHLLRAQALIALNDKVKARTELEYVLKLSPDSNDAKYQLGVINFTEKNYKDADKIFEQMRQTNPGDLRGLFGVVQTQIAEGDVKSAVQMLEGEVAKHPDSPTLLLGLANVEVQAQMFDAAIKNYQALIAKDPKSADIYIRIAEVYRLKGDQNAAIENFRKASTLAPTNMFPLTRLAMLLDAMERKDQAKPLYEQILRSEPDNAVALNNLAYMMAEQGSNIDQALAYATRAKQRVPQDPDVSDTLGVIYIKKGMSDEAVRLLQDLVAQRPGVPMYRYHLAMALYQKGDKPTAKKQAEQALQSKPSKEDQDKIRDLLQKIG